MRKTAKSRDGIRLKKGDKAWQETNAGLQEVVIGEHLPWTKKFIAKAQYCWASKKKADDWRNGKHLTKKDKELIREFFGARATDKRVRRLGMPEDENGK